MKVGFSLSPGGLLLPYHLGALASLSYHGILTEETPLAGSSAGAIAVAAHAARVPTDRALEASLRVSSNSNPLFVASGGLMPRLRSELNSILDPNAHRIIDDRPGMVGLAHFEVYPQIRSKLETTFDSKESLVDAICDSSMFPYFTSNRPWNVYTTSQNNDDRGKFDKRWKQRRFPVSKIAMDGIFTEPPWRLGCPDIRDRVDREVKIIAFPEALPGLLALEEGPPFAKQRRSATQEFDWCNSARNDNVIAPRLEWNFPAQASRLGLMAVTAVPRKMLTDLYEAGFCDAERWVRAQDPTIVGK